LGPFISFTTNVTGSPSIRRAVLVSLAGVMVLWVGAAAASVMFCVGAYRLLFSGLRPGVTMLLTAVGVGGLARALATVLLRIGTARLAHLARASRDPGDAQHGSGVIIDGEVVATEGVLPGRRKPITRQ